MPWTPEVPPDEVKRRIEAGGLDRREVYRLCHQHPLNKLTHVFGIPLVIASAIYPFVAWARTGAFGWEGMLILGAVGWGLQFLGHGIEGNSPAFFRDLRQLLVGPVFILTLPLTLLRGRKKPGMKTITVTAAREERRALLLPGNDLRAEFYRPLAGALAARGVTTTLVTLDLAATPTWPACLAALHAAYDEHAGERGLLVGHSLGGLLALLVAARRPRGLSRLVLLEPAIAPWRWLARRMAARYRRDVVLRDRDRFVNWTGTHLRVARPDVFPAAALELYAAARREDDPAPVAALLDALPTLYPLPFDAVDVPTLVVSGACSGWRARLGLWLLARRLRARRASIANAAHWLANEADDAVANAIAGA